ncbi:MAG: pilus assembly protein PilM, partial [Candidatus Omnitrophica bacterium]|nr:pilus assembly protein PilM [Candidatus Omnitrophota bacterium]
ANTLGIAVEYWDPFKKINITTNIDAQALKAASTSLAVAVGLALRK